MGLGLPLFLEQAEPRRAEKIFWRPPPVSPFLSRGLDDRASPLSQGLDPTVASFPRKVQGGKELGATAVFAACATLNPREGVPLGILAGGMPPGSPNPDPTSD